MNITTRPRFYRNDGPMFAGLVNLILTLPLWLKETTMIEIGSFIGDSGNLFSLFFKEVVCIDPHAADDAFSGFAKEQIISTFLANTIERGRNVMLISAESAKIKKNFPDNKYGFVYIDAVHQYPNVKEDILNYYPKVMSDGFIGGHDYGLKDNGCEGVQPAVDELFGEPDFLFEDMSWLIQKKAGRIKIS